MHLSRLQFSCEHFGFQCGWNAGETLGLRNSIRCWKIAVVAGLESREEGDALRQYIDGSPSLFDVGYGRVVDCGIVLRLAPSGIPMR
jgi:hypothetical protein